MRPLLLKLTSSIRVFPVVFLTGALLMAACPDTMGFQSKGKKRIYVSKKKHDADSSKIKRVKKVKKEKPLRKFLVNRFRI